MSVQEAATYGDLQLIRSRQGGMTYKDLHGLPCLLILTDRGCMGDTFPQTLQYWDTRLRSEALLASNC